MIDETKLANLLEISRIGKPQVCEVLRVEWSPTVIKYYANDQYDQIPPFRTIANYLLNSDDEKEPIDARLAHKEFLSYELAADLSTDNLSLTFADADGDIKDKFDTYGEGVHCELYHYYPQSQVNLFTSVWWGNLTTPDFTGRGILQVTASNGFRSREQLLPRRTHPDTCPATFGGELTDIDEFRGNGCPYNKHLGGSIGNLDGGDPYTFCDKSETHCIARLGTLSNGRAKYFQGFTDNAGSVATDANNPNYLASSKGNSSKLKEPIGVVYGAKHLRDLPNLFFRNENNSSDPNKSWVRGVWEIGETCETIDFFQINGLNVPPLHLAVRNGELGQSPLPYTADMPGMSGTALVQGAHGWVPANSPLSNFSTFVRIPKGYNKIRVYSDAETFTEEWTDNRIWCLLEAYTNMRFGRGYRHDKFHIEDLIEAADYLDQSIRFTITDADAVATNYDARRDEFGYFMRGRAAQEQIIDICRAGRISVPFQYQSKYTISALRKWSTEELGEARVFTDKGQNRNIVWNGVESIKISQIKDSELTNEIVLTYEDKDKQDKEAVITAESPAQKIKAAKILGESSTNPLEKRFVATGIRNRKQAIKFAFSLLNLGQFDEGGIENNLRLEFDCIFEQALGLKKFDVVKVESDLLSGFDFEYFRVLKMRKNANHHVTLTLQAYPVDYYASFETDISPVTPDPIDPPPTEICIPTFGSLNYSDGLLEIPVNC